MARLLGGGSRHCMDRTYSISGDSTASLVGGYWRLSRARGIRALPRHAGEGGGGCARASLSQIINDRLTCRRRYSLNKIVLAVDLLHPSPASERRKHKLKRLVPHPNSYFMDVKCPGCYKITTVFSHAQRVVVCAGCSTILCQPTGGRARLTEGCSFRRKQH
ncbi:40S ribosomal protein S27 [Papilio xuthus]|uniref:40S ribosomal protein S27 n=14 Tax=Papilionoidea TaxID=37572 RepID=A0A194PL86_PAPXU|nr:40S ribosomal protein S27 [Papilio xuthus]